MIKKQQAADAQNQRSRYNDDGGYGGGGGRGGGRGGGDRRNERDNRRDDRRDGEKVYMKKQSSVMSNFSDGQGRGNNRNRRDNRKGAGGNESGSFNQGRGGNTPGGKGEQSNRPDAFELTEDQLKTRMQVLFNKFVMDQTPSEEEKKEEVNFQVVKDLITSGSVKTETETKRLRADDVFSYLIQKMMDMD